MLFQQTLPKETPTGNLTTLS